MTLADIAIKRPVFAWMMMIALMVFGAISMGKLGISKLPDVDFPTININLSWEGAAPEVMESDVVDVVEDALTSVQGIREISSSVRQGQASVSLELDLERDVDTAVQEVQTKLLQAQRQLPREIDPPIVTKTNPEDQPILWLTVTGTIPLREMMDYTQNHLKDHFSTINGVGEVFLGGLLERNLRIWLDIDKLNQYELTATDIVNTIEQNHRELPAGRIETPLTEQNVRAMGEGTSVEDFENMVIERRGGQPIYTTILLKDVARVEDGLADLRRISRRNGQQAIGLGIRKQRGVNTVEVGKRVMERMEKVQKDLPAGIQLALNVDNTRFIKDSIHELKFTLILSAIVTSLVCWLFLGSWSATFNILLAIPTSILGTFIFIQFLGFTLNTFTMLALSLAIGIVVDDAIMVLENIMRYREKGLSREEAASVGARQITFAATATTIAIIAIFLPIAFMSGVMGKYFYEFAVTISIAVGISLVEALTFTPMRCAQMLEVGKHHRHPGGGGGRWVDDVFNRVSDKYRDTLGRVLTRRVLILGVAFLTFFGSLVIWKFLRKEFIPAQDQSLFFCRLQTPVGSSIMFTDEKFKEVEAFIQDRPEVSRYFAAIGGFGGGEVNSGQILVTLKDPHERPVTEPYKKRPSQTDVMAHFRKELNKIPNLKVRIQDPSLSGFSARRGYPIEMSVIGPNWQKLTEFSKAIETRMEQSKLMTDVDTNYEEGVSEIRIYPNRKEAAARGVSMQAIAESVNALIAGQRVAKYTKDGRRYDVRVRLVADQRLKAEDINAVSVWNNRGEMVKLKDVVTIDEKPTTLTITRLNRERAIRLFANVAPGQSQIDAIADAQRIANETLPEGYRAVFGGNTQVFKESFSSLGMILWLGLLVAYMVLASQFNSYKDPLIILLALPFSVTGALLALWITGQSINIYSFIGIVLLMGIVKKNSIMLVDFTNQLRAQGLPVHEALKQACPHRLRPILMTSFATIAAAIPPAMALGPGAEIIRPMATTVIGGVLVSTFLTLYVIPCAYALVSKDKK